MNASRENLKRQRNEKDETCNISSQAIHFNSTRFSFFFFGISVY